MYFILIDLKACIRLVVYGWDNCFITTSLGDRNAVSSEEHGLNSPRQQYSYTLKIGHPNCFKHPLIDGIGISMDMKLQIMECQRIFDARTCSRYTHAHLVQHLVLAVCQAKACTKWQEVGQLGRSWQMYKQCLLSCGRSPKIFVIVGPRTGCFSFHCGPWNRSPLGKLFGGCGQFLFGGACEMSLHIEAVWNTVSSL